MTGAPSVSERLAHVAAGLAGKPMPPKARARAEEILIDIAGLCVAARGTDYVKALIDGWDGSGDCTAIGHAKGFDAAGAAVINGTASHGEDFDDTFEGGPVHAGVVIVPAVLAAAERYGRPGSAALLGLAFGTEVTCRLSTVVPKAIHKSGFHPTAVLGAMGAASAVAVTLGVDERRHVHALGLAGSMAGGIIEYLAEGSWSKRLHPGWAAQSGLRAALMARHGFEGPRTVFEGEHGLFHGFAHTTKGNWDALLGELGKQWVMETIAFKPYACGTMTHPYIDCARRLARRGIRADDIVDMECEVGEGTVHRLWEPLAQKQAVPNAYAGKFSTPYCIAVGFLTDDAGLGAFTEEKVADPRIRALAAKVRYVIDSDNPYPRGYTGHIRATLKDGSVVEERQPHLRGGDHERLSRQEIEEKFRRNAAFGGWPKDKTQAFLAYAARAFDGKIDLKPFRG
ncbi:MAG: MmgE/PrpD family protein [Alphaproteobacteria bacterium]|nr:MmgE/PrpD family protein [Alphaproteobacteria bacterium]